jgi:hypothetical protein
LLVFLVAVWPAYTAGSLPNGISIRCNRAMMMWQVI